MMRSVIAVLFGVLLGAAAYGQEYDVVLAHESRGPQSVHDVVRSNAHDAFHHRVDGLEVARIRGERNLDFAAATGALDAARAEVSRCFGTIEAYFTVGLNVDATMQQALREALLVRD